MKMSKMLSTVFLVVFCLAGTQVMASPIQDWNISLEYGFDSWTETSGLVGHVKGLDPNDSGKFTKLEWGYDPLNWFPESYISVSPGNTFDYTLGDSALTVMDFTHHNATTIGRSLDTATLHSDITVKKADGTFILDGSQDFYIKFWETSLFDDSWGKKDVFLLENSDDLINPFEVDGWLYTLTFAVENLIDVTIDDDMRERFGFASDVTTMKGLLTDEGKTNSFGASLSISAEPMPNSTEPLPNPEPATMLLFGFGMLTMAGVLRRKQ